VVNDVTAEAGVRHRLMTREEHSPCTGSRRILPTLRGSSRWIWASSRAASTGAERKSARRVPDGEHKASAEEIQKIQLLLDGLKKQ